MAHVEKKTKESVEGISDRRERKADEIQTFCQQLFLPSAISPRERAFDLEGMTSQYFRSLT
jgi:hypothetical protein